MLGHPERLASLLPTPEQPAGLEDANRKLTAAVSSLGRAVTDLLSRERLNTDAIQSKHERKMG